jgi:hypothetical protein
MTVVTAAPPYSIIFICDNSSDEVEVPERVVGKLIAANDNCISVATNPSVDGDTEICLTRSISAAQLIGLTEAFTGVIASPNQRIDVATAENEVLLSTTLASRRAAIRIWTDQSRWPTKIVILVNDA